jgi:hypothetical protein
LTVRRGPPVDVHERLIGEAGNERVQRGSGRDDAGNRANPIEHARHEVVAGRFIGYATGELKLRAEDAGRRSQDCCGQCS